MEDKTILAQLHLHKCRKWWDEVYKGDERAINYIVYGIHELNSYFE